MPTSLLNSGWRLFYPPTKVISPFIHVRKGEKECKYRLDCENFELEEAYRSLCPEVQMFSQAACLPRPRRRQGSPCYVLRPALDLIFPRCPRLRACGCVERLKKREEAARGT